MNDLNVTEPIEEKNKAVEEPPLVNSEDSYKVNTPPTAVAPPAQEPPILPAEFDEEHDPADDENEEIFIPVPILGIKTEPLKSKEPTLQVAKRCDLGAVRDRNEDSCLIFTADTGGYFPLLPFGLYIVADGMGGHKNGHIASKTASRVASHHIINQIYMPLLQSDGLPIQAPIQEVLVDAAHAAHMAVYSPDPEKDSGTTLTVALVLGRRLYVAHVGDTRIYLLSDDKLEMVTTDHSLVQRLQDVGQLTAEDATFHQYRHILLRALGQTEELEIDSYMRLLPKSGKLLLCTDGLTGMISDKTIHHLLSQNIPLQEIADQLYDAAMQGGGVDNITAVVVSFHF